MPDIIPLVDLETRTCTELARFLLGKIFVLHREGQEPMSARIVETEAYLGGSDPASHSYCGPTRRNASMFGAPGLLYVYRSYGVHWCANVVAEAQGIGAAVLIRSAEPMTGKATMQLNRNSSVEARWCRGPGNFTKAFGISGQDDGQCLAGPQFWLEDHLIPSGPIATSTRIGISKASDAPLRFYLADSALVSARRYPILDLSTGQNSDYRHGCL